MTEGPEWHFATIKLAYVAMASSRAAANLHDLNDVLGAHMYSFLVRECVMSFRLKSFLVVIQLSFLIWGAIIYAGFVFAMTSDPEVDQVHTASVR